MQWPVTRPWERWLVAGLFNWTDETRPLVFDPLAWDMPAGRGAYHLFDLWRRTHMGPQTGPVLLPATSPHGVASFAPEYAITRVADEGFPGG